MIQLLKIILKNEVKVPVKHCLIHKIGLRYSYE